MEDIRSQGEVGSSLQAEVEIRASGDTYDALASLGDELKFVTVTSAATLVKGADGEATVCTAHKTAGEKCARCWSFSDTVGSDPAHPDVCKHCAEALS